MSSQNGQTTDLKSMARTRRRSNNRHTTFSQRERLPSRYHDIGPWTVTPPTVQPVPQNRTVHPEAANHNPAGAPSTNFFPGPANQPISHPATPSASANNTILPMFSQITSTNNPGTPTTASAPPTPQQNPQTPQTPQTPAPKPQLQPSSPTASVTSANLEDIDLRSPSDDPDYDFIDASEATHSARNAQPDRAEKYPELGKGGAKVGGASDGSGGKEAKVVGEAKKKGRAWFGFLK